MRVRRSFLYWGAFLMALGGVLLAADLNRIDGAAVRDALRLWPLVLIAAGVALILRRTRIGWAGGMLAAALPGLALGGAVVAGSNLGFICGGDAGAPLTSQQGLFSGPATIRVTMVCGDLEMTAGGGSGWRFDAGNSTGLTAAVDATPSGLTVRSGRVHGLAPWRGRDTWHLAIPSAVASDLALEVDAGAGRLNLAGAQLGSLSMTADAAEVHADLRGASVNRITANLNAGALGISLPDGSEVTGSLTVNAGSLTVCAPAGLGLRIHSDVTLGSSRYPGLVSSGGAWESPDYATAAHHAQLTVEVNAGSIELNPTGGCQ
jgi:hypothetical protein